MLQNALIPLFLFLLFTGPPQAPAAESHRLFTLSIEEKRFEEIVTPGADSGVPADFRTDSALYGRFIIRDRTTGILSVRVDSITATTTQPFPFQTFMSRDTIYFRAEGRPNIIGRRIDAITDSMLQCVFDEPIMEIALDGRESDMPSEGESSTAIRPRSITSRGSDCGSGEYSRINPAVSLGVFFTALPGPAAGVGFTWDERKPLPSFSKLHFFPELDLSMRIVAVTGGAITAIVNSDTSFTDSTLTMPGGEEIDLIEDRIHIGGTIVTDAGSGIVTKGELRIDEEISYLRPRLSTLPASKRCSYRLRLESR